MVMVPRYDGPKEKLNPVPNVQVSGGSADSEAFGAGPSSTALSTATRTAFQNAEKVAIQAKQKADEVAYLNGDLKAAELQTRLKVEARKMRGQDAFGAPDFIDKEWQKGYDEIRNGLQNEEQKAAFDRAAVVRRANLNEDVQLHVASESIAFDTDTTNAYIETARNEGVASTENPDRMALSLFQQEQAIVGYADRNGWSKEQIEAKITQVKSDSHVAFVDKMLNDGQVDLAKKYYTDHKSEIVGKEANRFPEYIDATEKRMQEQAAAQKELDYDNTMRQSTLLLMKNQMPLSEAQRLYREDKLKLSDYNFIEGKLLSKDYDYKKTILESDPEAFNEIRQAQLDGSKTPGEISRMIMIASNDQKIKDKDGEYLLNITQNMPPDPKDQHINSQVNNVREFGNRYFSEGLIAKVFKKDEKPKRVEGLVNEFLRRVDAQEADGEKIDEIANQVMGEFVKKDYPEVSRLEDLPHVIVDVNGKIQRLLNPEQKTKLKARYKITPLPPPAEKKEKPKK